VPATAPLPPPRVAGSIGGVADAEAAVKRKRAGSPGWPTFDAPLLRGVASAFLSRRKPLRYQDGLRRGREFSETAGGVWERFDLDLRGGHIRLSVWADGGLWVSVCVPGRGRHTGWSFHGDMRDVSPHALVGMVEATLALPFGEDPPRERERLRDLWGRVRPRSG
jgi:hypothetical protein